MNIKYFYSAIGNKYGKRKMSLKKMFSPHKDSNLRLPAYLVDVLPFELPKQPDMRTAAFLHSSSETLPTL